MKKPFLLRIDEEMLDRIKSIAEVEERSINYILCKLIDKGLNSINLDKEVETEIEEFALKNRITKKEAIEGIWRAYRKTYK
jgi:hypothetical protein